MGLPRRSGVPALNRRFGRWNRLDALDPSTNTFELFSGAGRGSGPTFRGIVDVAVAEDGFLVLDEYRLVQVDRDGNRTLLVELPHPYAVQRSMHGDVELRHGYAALAAMPERRAPVAR